MTRHPFCTPCIHLTTDAPVGAVPLSRRVLLINKEGLAALTQPEATAEVLTAPRQTHW